MSIAEMPSPATDQVAGNGLPLGPDSLVWKYFADNRMALLGPRAAVLQNMLPSLGQGVEDHSVWFAETLARLQRSIPPIFNTVYGADAEAGHQVRDFHPQREPARRGGSEVLPQIAEMILIVEPVVDFVGGRRFTESEIRKLDPQGDEARAVADGSSRCESLQQQFLLHPAQIVARHRMFRRLQRAALPRHRGRRLRDRDREHDQAPRYEPAAADCSHGFTSK